MNVQPPDLTGQVALVTGSSRGIGKDLALALARAGANIVVAAKSAASRDRLPGSIHETAAEIESLGRQALAVRTDLRSEADVQEMIRQTIELFGRLDVLVNNAGALWMAPVVETPSKRFDLVMQVNARAAFLACHYALPHMLRQGGGRILNISPPYEPELLPGKVAYMISKVGMTFLTYGLAQEVRDDGVAVCSLWPATMIESQATINHEFGGPEQWRKAAIVSDAALFLLRMPLADVTGKAWLDEDVLRLAGVTDFSPYNCVPGGEPFYIAGPRGRWSQ